MNFKIDLNLIFGFIILAQLSESFNVYLIDKHGNMEKLQKPIHIDSEYTTKDMREKFAKQFDEFLRKSKKHYHHTINLKKNWDQLKNIKRADLDSDIRNQANPVVYSNGRYTLDLDKIDVDEVKEVTTKPEKESEVFDPAESFRDYYDYLNINDHLVSPNRAKDKRSKILNKSLRKYNKLLVGGKIFRTKNSHSPEFLENILKRARYGKRSFKKRFKIINNRNKKKKHEKNISMKKKKQKVKFSSEYDYPKPLKEESKPSREEYEGKPKKRKKKKKQVTKEFSEESGESDDGFYYLQGNELTIFKPKASKVLVDNDDSNERQSYFYDGRKRLQHFLPKRFHWNPDEIKHLGYFWFNGPRGKYPEATPLT